MDLLKNIEHYSTAAILLLLPLVFNPFSDGVFEATKVDFFRCFVGVMAVAFVLRTWFQDHLHLHRVVTIQQGTPKARRALSLLYFSVLTYGTIHIVASFYSDDLTTSLWGDGNKHGTVTTIVTLIFFYIISKGLPTRRETTRMIAALLIGTVPVSLYGIVQALGMDPLVWETDSYSPTLSTIGRSNFVGAYLSMAIPFTLFFFKSAVDSETSRFLKQLPNEKPGTHVDLARQWRLIVLATIQLACLVLTQARAALLASMAGSVTFIGLLAYRARRQSYLKLIFAISVIALGALLLVSTIDVTPQSSTTLHGTIPDVRKSTILSRLTIWRGALEIYGERWLLGYGPESFAGMFNTQFPPAETWGDPNIRIDDPHNIVLNHLIATGAIGALAFVMIVGASSSLAAVNLRKAEGTYEQNLAAATAGSAMAFLVQAQFNPVIVTTQVLFWWTLALCAATASRTGSNA
jgi:O-antigen ligase